MLNIFFDHYVTHELIGREFLANDFDKSLPEQVEVSTLF